mmetsp:Transcript_6601/g.18651  ORF Transcript_6601/g.18651 Transcript_6601/m.18651 type:complete len:131 (+) Transcript_6601:219-611(+)
MRRASDRAGVGLLVNLVDTLLDVGFNVVVVCDGAMRHHSKRSSIDRSSKRSLALLRRRELFAECSMLAQQTCEILYTGSVAVPKLTRCWYVMPPKGVLVLYSLPTLMCYSCLPRVRLCWTSILEKISLGS